MIMIKIGRRGQITLPSALRQQFGLREGDNLAVIPQDELVILKPLHRTLLDLRGSVPVSSPQDLNAVRHQAIQQHIRRLAEDKGEYEP
jgi:AbrB family looped-hinge helix DNA binding protein